MKLHNPLAVIDDKFTFSLAMSMIMTGFAIAISLIYLLFTNTFIVAIIVGVLAISRIGYAVIKGK